jgi:eukaryotic-like serine/threonine-protein kinase
MPDVWRCEKGHSGTLDQAPKGGLPKRLTRCPVCGDTLIALPRPSAPGDHTFLNRGESGSLCSVPGPHSFGSNEETKSPEEGVPLSDESLVKTRPDLGGRNTVLPNVAGYDLLAELGHGGMGVVYKARQQGLNRLVALKMILAANRASDKDLARFNIEAEAVAQLLHPNIVQIYEIGERDGCPFFSLEFVSGGTLAERTAGKPQPPQRAARLVRMLAQAMDFAHRRGIVHRDLKPANILLALPGNVPVPRYIESFPFDVSIPKITDFGLAKRLEGDSGHTRDGAIMGTPNYMAPEQAKGKNKEVGPAADIYALGSILYDLLTGLPPFKGSTIMETLEMVVNREPVPPRKINALVPGDLSTICLKCLEKDPAKRYATAGDLAEDLRRYLEGEPIQARPCTWIERTLKWTRRRPAAAMLVAVSVLAVLSLSIGGVALALHEMHIVETAHNLQIQAETARTAADAERAKAETQRRRAEDNFLDACRAVDEMLSRVGNQRLAHEPRMEQVRRELLQKAREFYEKFLNERGDDPQVQWQAARSSWQLGYIERMLGNPVKAEANYREAIERLDQVVARYPANVRYREDLAQIHEDRGSLLSEAQRLPAAETQHLAAQALRQQLAEEDGNNPRYRQLLALSSLYLGQIQYRRGEFNKAKQTLTDALEQMRRVSVPGDTARHWQIAQILNKLGQTHQLMGNAAAAKSAYEEAKGELQRLIESHPRKAVSELREELAMTFNNLGELQRDTNPAEAETAYREAVRLSEELAADFPATPMYRQEMAGYMKNLSLVLLAKGDGKGAEELSLLALDVKRRLADNLPWLPDYRRDLVAAQINRGVQLLMDDHVKQADQLYTEAGQTIRALVHQYPDIPNYQLEQGKCLVNHAAVKMELKKVDDAESLSAEGMQLVVQLAARWQDVPEYRYELARTHDSLGTMRELQGDALRAERHYRAARETLKLLVEKYADEPDYTRQLAVTCNKLANLLSRAKDSPEAFALWKQARELLEPLAKRYRGVPGYRSDLSHCYDVYPLRLVLNGKLSQAEIEWETARRLQEELVKDFPRNRTHRLALARTWANLALVAVKQQRNAIAVERYRESVKVLEDYKGRDADDAAYQAALLENATCLANYLCASKLGDSNELLTAQQRVVALCQKLAAEQGATPPVRAKLAEAQKNYGQWLLEANRAGEARKHLEEAVANQRQVVDKLNDEPPYRTALLGCYDELFKVYEFVDDHAALAQAGEHQLKCCGDEALPRAVAAARLAWCSAAVDRDKKLTDTERVVLRLLYAERAMRYLDNAAQRGFKDAATFKNTPHFTPLQHRADYKALLDKLEKGL